MASVDIKNDYSMEAGLLSTDREERIMSSKEALLQDSESAQTIPRTKTRRISPAGKALIALAACCLLGVGVASIGGATRFCPGHLRHGDVIGKHGMNAHRPNLSDSMAQMVRRQNTPAPTDTEQATDPTDAASDGASNAPSGALQAEPLVLQTPCSNPLLRLRSPRTRLARLLSSLPLPPKSQPTRPAPQMRPQTPRLNPQSLSHLPPADLLPLPNLPRTQLLKHLLLPRNLKRSLLSLHPQLLSEPPVGPRRTDPSPLRTLPLNRPPMIPRPLPLTTRKPQLRQMRLHKPQTMPKARLRLSLIEAP
ncbi:uncharacterized protein BKA55DRAFT_368394 [Fusarium redolens]|uniref:Uncharacterized protein n=1 Tax=Fusarium redolens TaxID=48865 RepID=A0A9P9H2I9_FUSRE|nr:uncharacterized protein BKA55DRAFT_368394 [Fusarium redolens]KAH7249979.1 hypothetical protein BKA55DRAFT_368394 [Fusarium redolens]